MKVIGKMIFNMDKGMKNVFVYFITKGLIILVIKESIFKERNKVKVYIYGQMEVFLMECGLIIK